jgi:hypothetical protein
VTAGWFPGKAEKERYQDHQGISRMFQSDFCEALSEQWHLSSCGTVLALGQVLSTTLAVGFGGASWNLLGSRFPYC